MDKTTIARVQSFGFKVYMRDPADTYMLFTDESGELIGYLQQERFGVAYSISTVHIPNTQSGTGFQVARLEDAFDKEKLEQAFAHAPAWADNRSRSSVKKWRDIEHYRSASSFNDGYALVPPVTDNKTEIRFFAANVRKAGTQGSFGRKVFELVVTITGSHHALMDEAIRLINAEGYEVQNIIEHSTKRNCV